MNKAFFFLFALLCFFSQSFLLSNPPKIALVTLAIGDKYQKTVQESLENKKAYCAKHGYDFVCGYEKLDPNPSRHITWNKILFLKQVLESGKYDWVFWNDADAIIMNFNVKLEWFLDDDYCLIIHNHIFSPEFQTGNFFLKNDPKSLRFLDQVDRFAVQYLSPLKIEYQGKVFEYPKNGLDFSVNWTEQTRMFYTYLYLKDEFPVLIVPYQRLFGAFDPTAKRWLRENKTFRSSKWFNQQDLFYYEPGDFISHIATVGRSSKGRLAKLITKSCNNQKQYENLSSPWEQILKEKGIRYFAETILE